MITIELVPTTENLPNLIHNALAFYEMHDGDTRIYLCDSDNRLHCFTKNFTGDIIENTYDQDMPVDSLMDELEIG